MNLMTGKNTVEFFVDENQLFFITDGKKYPFSDITIDIFNMLNKDMEHNNAHHILTKAGITDPQLQIEQYAKCRYGSLTLTPDFINNKSVDSEFRTCKVENCRFGCKLCKVVAEYGELTLREQEICELVFDDQSDKQISNTLDISINTVHTHIRSILSKLGDGCTRVKIAVFYSKHATV